MAAVIGVLGAGSHGQEIAAVVFPMRPVLFDDFLDGYRGVGEFVGEFVIGAAWPDVRWRIARKAKGHPANGTGIVVFPGGYVSPSARLGLHTHVGPNAVVSHGCHVGAFVQICAGAVLGGDVRMGDSVFVGINASVLHGGISIGDGATIGAGAVVTRDVKPGVTVAGVPAREMTGR